MAVAAGGGAGAAPVSGFQDELAAFMWAIGQQESGGNYHIRGPHTKYGRPLGKYQILDSNWAAWAREAGIPGADWRDPKAQERVAAFKFTQYFEKYGRWDAVAVAWFAGPGRANRYIQNPSSVANMSDVLGTSVAKYVQMAMNGMSKALGRNVQMPNPASTGTWQDDTDVLSARRLHDRERGVGDLVSPHQPASIEVPNTPEGKAANVMDTVLAMFEPEFVGQQTVEEEPLILGGED